MLPESLKKKPLLDKQPNQLLFQNPKNVFFSPYCLTVTAQIVSSNHFVCVCNIDMEMVHLYGN